MLRLILAAFSSKVTQATLVGKHEEQLIMEALVWHPLQKKRGLEEGLGKNWVANLGNGHHLASMKMLLICG